MAKLKYFAWIDDPAAPPIPPLPRPLPGFDFSSLGSASALSGWLQRLLLRYILPGITWLLRWAWPIPRFGRIIFVLRRADAAEVLGDKHRFRVVYGPEMQFLGGGADNMLSVDGPDHDRLRHILQDAMSHRDIEHVALWSRQSAEALAAAAGGRIDVMRDLLTRSAAEVSARWLGLTIHDPDTYAEWLMAVSGTLFGDFFGDPNARKQAGIASAQLCSLVDDGIARVRHHDGKYPASARPRVTLIDRLVADGNLSDAEIRAIVIGLATAFVPTNTLAGGNMLEHLLARPASFGAAQRAALAGDHAAFEALLLEAGRRNPALSPGLWRHLPRDAEPTEIAAGRWRRRTVRRGDAILVLIPSALRDRQRRRAGARADDPRRAAWMMFGSGPHDCLGARLALAHLTAVFATMLALPSLAQVRGKAGRMTRTGPYPTRMEMQWDAPLSQRANILAALPVRDGTAIPALEEELADGIGNPVHPALRQRLDAAACILFTSVTVVEAAPGSAAGILIVEINADGTRDSAIHAFCSAIFGALAPVLRHCTQGGLPPASPAEMAALIGHASFELHQKPWGISGLHFDGLPQLSVADIDRQQQLADFARRAIEAHQVADFQPGSRAMDVLLFVRRLTKQDSFYAIKAQDRADKWGALFAAAAPFEAALQRPSRKRLGISEWTPPSSIWSPLWPMLSARDNRWIPLSLAAMTIGIIGALGVWLRPDAPGSAFDWTWAILTSLAGGVTTSAVLLCLLGAVFLWRLRSLEKQDVSDDAIADLAAVRRIAAKENAPLHAQNHIVALMPFKPGCFRRLTFAFSMWGIKQAVTYWFRPGFVVTMGTIHKARWFRLPGTRQFMFFSNYDGSWESYLEDFITRAHEGQTAAWSHGVGFPASRFLILDGAANGDRFKRWVRRQQRVTPAWYSRFPELTAKQIRANAMIEDGLARAANDTDARRWLAQFGSAQREPQELETQESQTLVFAGFGQQSHATALAIRLPGNPDAVREWLAMVSGHRFTPPPALADALKKLLDKQPERDASGAIRLPYSATLRFGDIPIVDGGAALGFTARGLQKCGLEDGAGLEQFPAPFRMTMAGRRRILGDSGAADDWRFTDAQDSAQSVDAMIFLYHGAQPSAEARLAKLHRLALKEFGFTIVHEIPCSPVMKKGEERRELEHFGFRDGISQPVIAGTRKSRRPTAARDIINPGEFLLGYPNDQRFIAPPISVGAELDPVHCLPTVGASLTSRFPEFGGQRINPDLRDFGRNGSFLVVRQLDQDVRGFNKQLKSAAQRLSVAYPQLEALQGRPVDADWLGAKIVGRWKDGTPLVGNNVGPLGLTAADQAGNDFAYGVDDPRGLACPLGSHIRRTNPRDSLEPGDADEQRITNRHRLIRRGRTYDYRPAGQGKPVKGQLFAAICSDLERQFEFVQHGWINAASFHGLTDEPDPLFGTAASGDGSIAAARPPRFSIPTEAGTITVKGLESYVTLRGGGYFFLPSRAALQFLIHRLQQAAAEAATPRP